MTAIDLDRAIDDLLVLDTVPGGVDHLGQELRELAEGLVRIAQRGRDYLVIRYAGPLRSLARGRLYSSCSVAVPDGVLGDRLADPLTRFAGLMDRLDESLRTGGVSALVTGPPAMRLRDRPYGRDRIADGDDSVDS